MPHKSVNIKTKLHHTTSLENFDKIKNEGISPKNKNVFISTDEASQIDHAEVDTNSDFAVIQFHAKDENQINGIVPDDYDYKTYGVKHHYKTEEVISPKQFDKVYIYKKGKAERILHYKDDSLERITHL